MLDKRKYVYLLFIFYPLFIFFLLEFLTVAFDIPFYILPKPGNIIKSFFTHFELILTHGLITLLEALLGLVIALILGIILGALFVYFFWLKVALYPLIFTLQLIPLGALGPIIINWFGFGISSKVILVSVFALFPILLSFLSGVKEINRDMFYWMKMLKANRFQIFRFMIFPFCFCNLFAGFKIALTYSITSAMLGEMLGAEKGLGIYLSRALSSFQIDTLFAITLFIVLMSFFLYFIADFIEKKMLPWKKSLNNKLEGFKI